MMKKFIVTGVLCLVSFTSYSQKFSWDFNDSKVDDRISPAVKEKIELYALEVRKIVIEEKIKMDQEVANTTDEEQKKLIAQKFSEQINERIQTLHFDLDDITKKQVEYTIMNSNIEELKKNPEFKELEKKHKPTNEVVGYISYGLMHFEDGDDESLNKHLGYSSGIDYGILYHRQLNQTSPFTLLTGLYMSWRTMRFDDDYFINRDEVGDVYLVQNDQNLEKSKLRSTYLVAPIGIKYSFSPLKNDAGTSYRNVERGISIGANIYGGIRINKNNIVKGEDVDYRDKDSNYNLNNLIYGGQFTLSLGNINLFVRQDFSPYFEDGTFDNRKMLQFGLNLGF